MDKQDDINDGNMSRTVNDLFTNKVSPSLEAKMSGDVKKDPLLNIINQCQQMTQGLDTMLEAALLLNAHSIETQMPELREQFNSNVQHLRDMIREGNAMAAQQKLEDVVKTFSSYKRIVASLFGRLTNIISEFPKYSSEISSIGFELGEIRCELLDDKALVITEDDYKRLAYELYLVLLENTKKRRDEDVKGVEQSTEEIIDSKKTIVDKFPRE